MYKVAWLLVGSAADNVRMPATSLLVTFFTIRLFVHFLQPASPSASTQKFVDVFRENEESIYHCEWSMGNEWQCGSLSHDGRFVVNTVPTKIKY